MSPNQLKRDDLRALLRSVRDARQLVHVSPVANVESILKSGIHSPGSAAHLSTHAPGVGSNDSNRDVVQLFDYTDASLAYMGASPDFDDIEDVDPEELALDRAEEQLAEFLEDESFARGAAIFIVSAEIRNDGAFVGNEKVRTEQCRSYPYTEVWWRQTVLNQALVVETRRVEWSGPDPMRAQRSRLESFFKQEINLYASHTRFDPDEDAALKSVCHAILWICTLDEFHAKNTAGYKAWLVSQPGAATLSGVRFARNRAVHQFPQLVRIDGGATFPLTLPAPFFEITWVDAAALPAADPKHVNQAQLASYESHLANIPIRFTFDEMEALFAAVP